MKVGDLITKLSQIDPEAEIKLLYDGLIFLDDMDVKFYPENFYGQCNKAFYYIEGV